MSIASEISRLNTAKADIKAALEGKGIPVSPTLKIDGYAELIDLYLVLNTTKVVARYNVTDTSNPIQICYSSGVSQFSEIEIDGVVQPSVVSSYTFSTTGIHIVWFTLADTTSIGERAFYNCSSLTSVSIPNNVTSIGEYAFYGCSGLTSVHISDIAAWCNISFGAYDSNPLYYANHLYMNGSEITDLVIPNSVTRIGNKAFSGCALTSVTIPNSVTSIGSQAFSDCYRLTSITIPNSVTSIGHSAFYSCSVLTSVTIGNGVTSIEGNTFQYCSGLTSVIIPASVTSIGDYAFDGCRGLTSITIPNNMTSIGSVAFSGCRGLTSIIIPASVTSIGSGAFYNCTKLASITSNATTAPTITSSTFRKVKTGGTLTVPSGSSGYDVWMQNANYYLGLYNWTKVEQ